MKSESPSRHQSIRSTLRLVGVLFCASLVVGIPITLFAYSAWYAEKIFPGVLLADRSVGGKSAEYSEDLLREYSERLQSDGAIFRYGGKKAVIHPQPIPLGSDSAIDSDRPLFDVDIEQTKNLLFSIGRTGTFIQQQAERFMTGLFRRRFAPVIIDSSQLAEALKKEFSFFHSPARNATFLLDSSGTISIKQESTGIEFDYDRASKDLNSALYALTPPDVTLTEKIAVPDITAEDLKRIKSQAEDILSHTPLFLTHDKPESDKIFDNKKKGAWNIPASEIITWISPTRTPSGMIQITFKNEKIRLYLEAYVAPDVLIPVRHPRFEMKEGRVVSFELASNGQKLDSENTARVVERALVQGVETPITVVLQEQESPYLDTPENNLRITELLTHNETSFAGSPTNRRKNITRGSELINGLLIVPGEEFSLVKALGAINRANGFLPELVIKGSKTTPEFGGGLCQVSTTLFRAVSFAGLAVLERRNHSYRVSYYEPPVGFDATIYDPAPDFRFKNDTEHYLLIQSKVKGNSMIVELWGTKDGRRVEIDTPTVYNIKKAGETKIIETTDLPPGAKKCTERAHNGADAIFDRRIFYADGSVKKETYKSHYVVWPAVCLIGKKPDTPKDESPQPASSQTPSSPTEQLNPPIDPPPDTLNGSAP